MGKIKSDGRYKPTIAAAVTNAAAEILLAKAQEFETGGQTPTEVATIIAYSDRFQFFRKFVGTDPERVPMNPPGVLVEAKELGLLRLLPAGTVSPINNKTLYAETVWGTVEEVVVFRANLKARL